VPALRQRVTDIPLLARFFLAKYAKKFVKRFDDIDPAGLDYLRQYAWPGNVRELQNVIERAVILSQGSLLEIAPLQPTRAHPEAATGKLRTLEAVEREHITRTLEATGWQISGAKGAAAILGMNPNTLRSRMLKLEISKAG
jgi:formate hydrogenlyase transcriptional activator